MELQLCLSLSTYDLSKGRSHLNKHGLESKEIVSFQQRRHEGCLNKKRNFREAFDRIKDESQAKAFPLLVWSGQPNEDDDGVEDKKIISCKFKKNEAAEDHVVGWPPIKSWRKKLFHQHQGDRVVNNRIRREENVVSNSMYVKVKMDGVSITRKINLKLYNSYQALSKSLISMFAKFQKHGNGSACYIITYQDKDGDWLHAGDVPWQTFVESVQRLEIQRNG